MLKFTLNMAEREMLRKSFNLLEWGFEPLPSLKSNHFRNKDFFHVLMGDYNALFSSGQYSIPVQYDKLEEFLLSHGYKKQPLLTNHPDTNPPPSLREGPGEGQTETP